MMIGEPTDTVGPDATSEETALRADPILRPGRTCWRIARADALALIVDGADYFAALRKVMIAARRELLLIGWDFDFEIEMLPGESDAGGLAPDGLPNRLGAFLEALVERAPDLHVRLLKWNGAVLVAPGRMLPSLALSAFSSDRIHFALDGHHPFGAAHHQKIVVADDGFAFCGGIDATEERWDTSEHREGDPRRVDKEGELLPPWHDVTTAMTGPAAKALGALSRKRWLRATGEDIDPPNEVAPVSCPEGLEVAAEGIEIAIARTEPSFEGEPPVTEVERLGLDAIAAARDVIYIESQYFAAETICAALEARLREANGPEIVVINPQAARSELEDEAMHVLRGRMIERLKRADRHDRFRIYHPVNAAGTPIYVHAKVLIVDNRLLRIGSSNINDRSLGFDTECDVAIEDESDLTAAFRIRLLAEHLDVSAETLEQTQAQAGSLIAAIEVLNDPGNRGLHIVDQMPESILGSALANTRLFDPRHHPGEVTAAGLGIRPRHIAVATGVVALGWLAWRAWKKASRSPR